MLSRCVFLVESWPETKEVCLRRGGLVFQRYDRYLAGAGQNWRGRGSSGLGLHRWSPARLPAGEYLPTLFLQDVFWFLFGRVFHRFWCFLWLHLGAQEGAKSLTRAVPAHLGRILGDYLDLFYARKRSNKTIVALLTVSTRFWFEKQCRPR